MFPGGVPGVTQGIPPEYMKGNQPPPETAQAPAPTRASQGRRCGRGRKSAAAEPEQKPKPKPKKVAKPKPQPATGAGHCAAVRLAAAAAGTAGRRTAGRPSGWPGAGAGQHCVTLAFLAATRHLPALTAVGLDPKANRAANT